MRDLEINTAAVDRRPLEPSRIAAAFGIATTAAEDLADEVATRLEGDQDLAGRPIWRETVTEKTPGPGTQRLLLSRYPIEDLPVVTEIESEFVVDIDDYKITGSGRHALFRLHRWARSGLGSHLTADPIGPPRSLFYSVPYTAGWLMPGQIAKWEDGLTVERNGSTSYGDQVGWVRPTDRTITLRFEVTAPATGISALSSTQPAWPTVVGDTVSDGAVTFTARRAFEMPNVGLALLQLATFIQAGSVRDPRVEEEEIKDHRLKYRAGGGLGEISAGLRPLR